jgi:hypothetical protein
MVRTLVVTPPPHVLSHVDQSPNVLYAQSIGQFWVLQPVALDKSGHCTPPFCVAVMMERV